MSSALTDRLVRLSLGLPDSGMIRDGDSVVQAVARALLRVDGYAVGEELRLARAVEERSVTVEEPDQVQKRENVTRSL